MSNAFLTLCLLAVVLTSTSGFGSDEIESKSEAKAKIAIDRSLSAKAIDPAVYFNANSDEPLKIIWIRWLDKEILKKANFF